MSLFPLSELCHFLTSNFMKVYRQRVPCKRNSIYNFAHFFHGLKMCMWFGFNPAVNFWHFSTLLTFSVYIEQVRHQLHWSSIYIYWSRTTKTVLRHHYFIRRVIRSNFVVVTFLLISLRKGHFKRYWFLMAEIALFMVFDIRLQASSCISMRNRWFVYAGWIYILVLCWDYL